MRIVVRNSINITLVFLSILYLTLLLFLLLQHDNMLSVSTDKMQPSIPKGSLLLYKAVEPKSLQIGDIVSFTTQDNPYSIGRIAGVVYANDELIFRTKFDANTWLDFGFSEKSDIHGIITYQIPYFGFLVDYSKTLGGKLLLVAPLIVMLSILFILNRYRLLKTPNE